MALWKQLNEESKQFQHGVRAKIDSMGEMFSFGSTVEAKKRTVKSEVEQLFRVSAQSLKSVKNEMETANAERGILEIASEPMELTVTVDGEGRILTAQVADRP